MAWTGFGGSWSNGVHSGGDDSGSIGGSSGGMRAPSPADIASQFSIATVEHKLQLRRFLIYKVMVPGVIPPVFRVKITPYHLELVVEHRTLLADSQVF